jgi:hypothetical protein
MTPLGARFIFFLASILIACPGIAATKRLVLIKVDGLPEDLLEQNLSQLPSIRRVFVERGAWLRNFYVRGVSLSAPSWSMLDTGQPGIIRGNAEFDRYIPRVYDYLNFFPFYFGYARSRRVDMPGVEVLDQSGIPLLIDSFKPAERYQSMQLFQRGVRWATLASSLKREIARPVRELIDEWQTGFEMAEGLERQEEKELIAALADPKILYLDYYTGDFDHTAHLSNDAATQLNVLKRLDATIGRIRDAIETSPLSASTVMVLVSDHGMNSTPGTYSQGYNLVRYFNSPAGGGHHVITTRHPMTEYKLRGLDPFVSSVVTGSEDSFYLRDQKDYPTAMLDLDGNERASIQLRNSDLNEIQILVQQLARKDLDSRHREAIRAAVLSVIDRNRAAWLNTVAELSEELDALRRVVKTEEAHDAQKDRHQSIALETWARDERGYTAYARMLRRLLDLKDSDLESSRLSDQALIPKGVLGEPNSIGQLKNYAIGLSPDGLAMNRDGALDLVRSFRRVNYFAALSEVRVRNVVQPDLGAKPVDFIAARCGPGAVFLYGDAHHEALLLSRIQEGELWLRYAPVEGEWRGGFPLQLFEDPELRVPGDRREWLSEWHPEREWFQAIHRTRYSNGVIGLNEYFQGWSPMELSPLFEGAADGRDRETLRRFVQRRRQVVEPDILVLASDHWNFNVRGFNPGGNHGSFFRISTHSVLMAAGAGVPEGKTIDRPYDSLSLVPTVLSLLDRPGLNYPGPVIEEMRQ